MDRDYGYRATALVQQVSIEVVSVLGGQGMLVGLDQ